MLRQLLRDLLGIRLGGSEVLMWSLSLGGTEALKEGTVPEGGQQTAHLASAAASSGSA